MDLSELTTLLTGLATGRPAAEIQAEVSESFAYRFRELLHCTEAEKSEIATLIKPKTTTVKK